MLHEAHLNCSVKNKWVINYPSAESIEDLLTLIHKEGACLIPSRDGEAELDCYLKAPNIKAAPPKVTRF